MKHECPICLSTELESPYREGNHDICPVCGIEYGYEDCGLSHEELRELWTKAGKPDWCVERKQPDFEGGVRWIKDYIENDPERSQKMDSALGKKIEEVLKENEFSNRRKS